jgi:methyl-accepting chemotaxis protein
MKLKSQILALGLAGALAAALVGGVGLNAARMLGGAVTEVVDAGASLQASQEADMMHDAIRGDAQMAILGALEGKAESIQEAEKGLKEHAQTFDEALSRLGTQTLGTASRSALEAAKPSFTRYHDAAKQVIAGAKVDAATGQQAMPAFQKAFADLEGVMAALSQQIEAESQGHDAAAKARVLRAAWTVGIALAVALVGLVLLSLWISGLMSAPLAHAAQVSERMAHGDLTNTIKPQGSDEAVQLLQSLIEMQSKLAGLVGEIKSNAERVASASMQIAQGNQDLSSRTEQQASALQQTSATMTQLGGNVRSNTESAKQASELAQGASQVAVRGGQMMSEVVSNMNGINESSRKIADIISVIDGIAFQTNILALNAAVEAARAGEQGRGFAVVAGEVRSLAGRSAEAAREIKSLITASVDRVEQGTALVGRAGQTMEEIVSSIKRVTDIATEISAASVEQTSGMDDVGRAVAQMDHNTQQNAALVEESAAAAASLSQQAQQLVRTVSAFQVR